MPNGKPYAAALLASLLTSCAAVRDIAGAMPAPVYIPPAQPIQPVQFYQMQGAQPVQRPAQQAFLVRTLGPSQTPTGMPAMRCIYAYGGTQFFELVPGGFCPASIAVR